MSERTLLDDTYVLLKKASVNHLTGRKLFIAVDKHTNQKSAIKLYKLQGCHQPKAKIRSTKEHTALLGLSHPHILKAYGSKEEAKCVDKEKNSTKRVAYVALELAKNGSLMDYIYYKGCLNENVARYYFRQLLTTIEYIHRQGLSHRNLTLQHLLLDEKFNIKISGFYECERNNKYRDGKFKTLLENQLLLPPEVQEIFEKSKTAGKSNLDGDGYSGEKVDLFSIGALLFTLITGHPPFSSTNSRSLRGPDLYNYFLTNKNEQFWEYFTKRMGQNGRVLTKDFTSLIDYMLSSDPVARLSISEIKSHPWFKGEVATHEEVEKEMQLRKNFIDKQLREEEQRKPKIMLNRNFTSRPLPNTQNCGRTKKVTQVTNITADLSKTAPEPNNTLNDSTSENIKAKK